jgi:phosphoadenosine phosphosulfate reductase
MPLIESHRPSALDLEAWQASERALKAWPQARLERLEARTAREVARFLTGGPAYMSVSWGKDSLVLADILARRAPEVELVWFRIEPIANPDCLAVRDAYLAGHDQGYLEVRVQCAPDLGRRSGWDADGSITSGARHAALELGTARHLMGIRAEESAGRARRVEQGAWRGPSCVPLGPWTADDVYAYLTRHALPVHPAYACSLDGALDRGRIRVTELGEDEGVSHGRADWEQRYYGPELTELRRMAREAINDGDEGEA